MRLNDWKLWTALAVVLFLGSLGYYFRPVVEEGVVAAKSISGEQDGAVHTIIRFNEAGKHCHIYDCENLFPIMIKIEEADEVVNVSYPDFEKIQSTKLSDYAENQLKTRYRYTDLRCIINVRTKIWTKNKTMGYYASKDDFNKVDPGDTVKFKILRKRDPTIKIIKVIDEDG